MNEIPRVAWDIVINNAITFYEELENGGIVLHLTVAVPLPDGRFAPGAPAVKIVFDKTGWERFQREVASGGVKSDIQIARPSLN